MTAGARTTTRDVIRLAAPPEAPVQRLGIDLMMSGPGHELELMQHFVG